MQLLEIFPVKIRPVEFRKNKKYLRFILFFLFFLNYYIATKF